MTNEDERDDDAEPSDPTMLPRNTRPWTSTSLRPYAAELAEILDAETAAIRTAARVT